MIRNFITPIYILCVCMLLCGSSEVWAQEAPCSAQTVALQPCATLTPTFTTINSGSTVDLPSSGVLCNNTRKDTWIKVVVPAGVEGIALYSDDYGGCGSFCFTDITGQWYQQGATCSTLTPIGGCFNLDVTSTIASGIYGIPVGGTTLYVRISEDDGSSFWTRLAFVINSGDVSTAPIPLATANGSYCNYYAAGNDCSSVNASPSCVGTVDNTIFYSFTVTAATPLPLKFNLTGTGCSSGSSSFQMVVVPTNCTGAPLASACNITPSTPVPQLSVPTIPLGNYLLVVDGTAGDKCYWALETTFNCDITNITVTPTSGCNNNGTNASTADDYYTANVTVTYSTPPATGNLVLSGSGSATVAVGSLGSSTSHTFTGVQLPANGSTTSLIAAFSATTACNFTKTGIAAVNNCSCLATIAGSSTICIPGGTDLLTASTGSSYAWATAGGTISGATNGSSISATAAGTYTVTVTNSVGCTASSVLVVTALASPTAGITGTASFCPAGNTVLTGTGGTGYAWSGGLPANTAANTITAAGLYTVTVTNGVGCTATSTVAVVASAAPTPAITGATGICTGANTTFTASGGASYSWTAGSGGVISGATNTSTALATAVGTYTVTATSAAGCTASTTKALTALSTPSAPTISGTPTVCSSGGALTTSLSVPGTSTTYTWTTTGGITGSTTTNAAIANAAGTYTIVISSASGCTASSTIAVTSVVCTAIPVCEGGTFTAAATGANTTVPYRVNYFTVCGGIVKGTNTTGIFNTTTMGLTNAANASNCLVYAVNDDGTATLPAVNAAYTVTGACFTQVNKDLLINALPSAVISGTTSFCTGGNTTLSADAGYSTYAWAGAGIVGASNTASIVANVAGTYTVTITNTAGCTSTSAVVVSAATCVCEGATFTAAATGANTTLPYRLNYFTVCGGIVKGVNTSGAFNTTTMGLTNAANASNCVIYAVNDDGNAILPSVSSAFAITGTTCYTTVTKPLIINAAPTASITGAAAFCSADVSTPLTAMPATGVTYAWATAGNITGSTTSQVANANATATYTVTVTNTVGCTATSTKAVTMNISPTASISGATSFCTAQGSTVLTTTGVGTYAWTTSGAITGSTTSATATAAAAGTYTVMVTAANTCTATATQTLTVGTSPTVTLAGGTTVCQGAANPMLTASGATSYTWSANTTGAAGANAQVSTAAGGTFTVTVTGTTAGCSATATQVVVVTALPIVAIAGAATRCQDAANVMLTASGATTYAWSANTTNADDATAEFVALGTAAGTYTVTVTGTMAGCSATATKEITISAKPNATISPSTLVVDCTTPSSTLTASGGGTYAWSDLTTGTSIIVTPTADASYTVTVTGGNGCTASAIQAVSVDKVLPTITTSYTQTCSNAVLTAAGASTTSNYAWSSNGTLSVGNSVNTVSVSTTYTVTGTNTTNGCSATSSQTIALLGGTASNFGHFASAVNFGVSTNTGSSYTNAFLNTNTQVPNANAISGTTIQIAGTTDYNSANLGAYDYRSSNLIFRGGEIKTWKNGSGNVCTPTMRYRVYKTGTTPPAFSSWTMTYKTGCPGGGPTFGDTFGPCTNANDQKWGIPANVLDLTTLCPDAYTIEVYYEVSGNDSGTSGCTKTIYDNNNCTNYKAFFTINDFNAVLTAGQLTCAPPATLTATPVVVPAAATLTPTTAITYNFGAGAGASNTATAATAGVYTVTISFNGCSATASSEVVANTSVPVVSASATTPIINCTTPSTTLTATGGGTYLWSNTLGTAATTAAVMPTVATTYTVTVTGTNSCTASTTVIVSVDKINPTINLTPSTPTCTNAVLTASGGATTSSYLWSTTGTLSVGNSVNTIVQSGTYTVTGTAANGCTATDTQSIILDGATAATNFSTYASATNFGVNGGAGSFYATNTTTGPDAISTTVYQSANLGAYAYRSNNLIFKGGEIKTRKSGTATVCAPVMKYRVYTTGSTPPAFSSATYTQKATCSANVFTDGFGPCQTNDQKWDNVTLNENLTNLCPDNYTVEVYYEVSGSESGGGCGLTLYDNNACANYKATFTISPYTTNATATPLTCAVGSGAITVNQPAPAAGITYDFGFGAGATASNTAVAPAASTYTVTISHNGCVNTASATVTSNITPPTVTASAAFPTINCTNTSTTLTATGAGTYLWDNTLGTNATTAAIMPTVNTTYTVTITAANGCTASSTVLVTVDKVAPIAALGTPGLICQGSPMNLTTTASITAGTATYAWTTPDGATISGANPIRLNAQPSMSGPYTVTITDSNGCTAESSEAVTVDYSTGTVELAQVSTNTITLHRNCDDGDWTYYSDPADHSKLLFGINWAVDGTLSTNNQAAKDIAEIKIQVRPSGLYGETAANALASEGTWTMKRWWEVHIPAAYTLPEAVNIRFFYDATEKAAIEAQAETFQNANCTNAYPNQPVPGKCGYEGFQWFKIDGVYSDANIATATTPTAVVQATPLTNTNASTALAINSVLYAQFNGLTSFSTGTGATGVGPAANPLPVKLLSFNGKINGVVNDLYWSTASEINSAQHILETSMDGTTDWRLVGIKRGAGTTNVRHDYALTDTKPTPRAYYRLRLVDNDGSFEYSNVILLERTKTNFGFVNVYPVPTNGQVTVDYNVDNAQSLTFKVIDVLGRELYIQSATAQKGMNQISFDLAALPSAMYMITMENGTRKTVFKVVKTD